MSSELESWANPSRAIVASRDERLHRRAVDNLIRDTKLHGLRVDAEAALTGRIMERAVDLDDHRRALAKGDPILDAVLARIEVNFVDKATRIQKSLGSEFPL